MEKAKQKRRKKQNKWVRKRSAPPARKTQRKNSGGRHRSPPPQPTSKSTPTSQRATAHQPESRRQTAGESPPTSPKITTQQPKRHGVSVYQFCVMSEDVDQKWHGQSRAVRRRLGIGSQKPWTSRPSFCGWGVPANKRMLDVIDCHVGLEKTKQPVNALLHVSDLMKGKFVDISQSVERGSHTNAEGCNRAFTTSTLLYDYQRDAIVTGNEMLLLHGHSGHRTPEDMPESLLRNLAGEGMSVPCLSALLWCLYLTKQFPE